MTTPSTEGSRIGDPPHSMHLVARLVRGYRWLARRELLACTFVLLLTLGLRAALLPWFSVPHPVIHDEFSYLLAADTYAHGRLTNPPHPFWQHFETMHVLQQPTYASKYQPLQGMVLAFGQKFFGQPWMGVYFSTGLMCAVICWMLQGWIAPEWALLGASLFMLRVGILSYWMNSYQGGAVPGIGGALALGALVRIWRRGQFNHSITWALGLAILVLSRPYDAAVLGCATAALLLWLLRKSPTPARTICVRVGLPALLVVTLCATAVAYNDYRVTGHALTLPYQVHDRQYSVASMFTMMPLAPEPAYRHAVIREFYAGWTVGVRAYARAHPGLLLLIKLYIFDNFYFPFWALFIPLLLLPYDLDTTEERLTVLLLLLLVLMIEPLIGAAAHYVAAFAGVIYLRFLHTLSRLWSWRPKGKPVGRALGVLLVGSMVTVFCFSIFDLVRHGENNSGFASGRDNLSQFLTQRSSEFGTARDSTLRELERQPGRHLVLVRYAPDHNPHLEWVYNRADIDAAKIVWAHDMSPDENRPFLEYFRDRQVWLLEPDRSPARLSHYPLKE